MLTTVTTAISPDHKSNCSKSIKEIRSRSIDEHKQHDAHQKDSFYLPASTQENCIDKGVLSDIFEKSVNKTLERQTTSASEFVINSTHQKMANGMPSSSFRKQSPDVLEITESITDPLPQYNQKTYLVNKKLKSMKSCSRKPYFKRQSHVRYVQSGKNNSGYLISHI